MMVASGSQSRCKAEGAGAVHDGSWGLARWSRAGPGQHQGGCMLGDICGHRVRARWMEAWVA